MIKLKYGNTNTFFIPGSSGGLLADTDYAGTLPAFYKAIKQQDVKVKDIEFVLATHYHPDHIGLIGQLMEQGVKLLLVDVQKDYVHCSDYIFERDKLPYLPIREADATVISCEESRNFLSSLGISGEIIYTSSHSKDSVSLLLDDGSCFVGDMDPFEYVDSYDDDTALKRDWEQILSHNGKRIFYAHRPEQRLG